ncbi:glycosyltransferase BC10-like [Rhododendron vialii]|uniref:glycosyltransferase BC10-like n=1 Tax=Rhododendron vialii TaxID=182163 RepID=UPI0026600F66|nr:glycosyltransferase BC10-like [Rhododendron vialii]
MARSRGWREEQEKSPGSITKDSSIGLLRLIIVLIIFVAGVVIGLSSSSHIDRHFSLPEDQLYKNYAMAPMPASTTSIKNCSVVSKCEKEDCLSMDSFLSPKNLTHGMSDDQLFWRASLMPKKAEYPYDRVPKVAFMFLTRGPLPMLPLWERFFKGHEKLFSIYVHALPGYELNVSNTSAFYGRQIPSQHVEWGTVSLFDAERRLLANALLDFSNERFVLLSESCIPIQNFPTVYQYLTRSSHSFVESYYNPSKDVRGRYSRWMWPTIRPSDWRKGSQWFEVNRVLAAIIVSDTKYYSIFRKYCTPSCYPDEHYIPTFLHLFYGSLNANRTVTWVDWSIRSPHPAAFGKANVTEHFVQLLRNNGTLCSYNSVKTSVCYLFARKFEPSALESLLNLSPSVMKF